MDKKTKITESLTALLTHVPSSSYEKSPNPVLAAQKIIEKSAWMAGGVSGALAVPVGPLGMMTVVPDLVAVWRIQAQMVSDIAAVYGKSTVLTRETLVYCLFQEGAGQLFRDVIVRAGDRIVLRRTSARVFENLIEKLGIRLSKRFLGKSISRWIPIAGAIAVGWYSRHDTQHVGYVTMDFFSQSIFEESQDPE
ncbi:EcsC family protein [Bdellovibrio bacteriovorus]|uniref:EcsC family protein n=1 Tax=Bdellovibrio bacteriovorus TaxID=959 RepID=UPI000B23659D|nr:EcsC family protein [Bdellovibrio bacteriovorus]